VPKHPLEPWYRANSPLLRLAQVSAGLGLIQVGYGVVKHWSRTKNIAAEATSLLIGANTALTFAIFLLLYEERLEGRRLKAGRRRRQRERLASRQHDAKKR
jgi:hypothetical protein